MGKLKDAVRKDTADKKGVDEDWLRLDEVVQSLHDKGFDFHVAQGRVHKGRPERDGSRTERVRRVKGRLSFAVLGDTHLGSRFAQETALARFYEEADDWNDGEGVSAFIHGGDFTQGTPKMHRGMEHEMHLHSAEGQVGYSIEKYPRSRHGTPTWAISGNHDDSWLNESGTNVIRLIARSRDDIHYIGQDACYFTLDGGDGMDLKTYVVHPAGAPSYAKSYKPQKLTESIPTRSGTQFVSIHHYHTYGVFEHQDLLTAMVPCFQGQYPYLVRLALKPAIGGIIVDAEFDENRITRFTHTFVSYDEVVDDFDLELSERWQKPGALDPT